MDNIITVIREHAVDMYGQKLYERNFADDAVDAMDIGLEMVGELADTVKVPIDTEVVNPAATALNRIRAGEAGTHVSIDGFAELIWKAFFDAALDGRTATGDDSATDMIGREVRVGDVVAYSWLGIDESEIRLGLVSGLRSSDLSPDVGATMFYGEHGEALGALDGRGDTAWASESLLVRR